MDYKLDVYCTSKLYHIHMLTTCLEPAAITSVTAKTDQYAIVSVATVDVDDDGLSDESMYLSPSSWAT
jgi:hypothetical protein